MIEAAMQAEISKAPLSGLVAMIRVADVERAAGFYRLLGFEIGNKAPRIGEPNWAWLYQPLAPNWKSGANLMLVRGEGPSGRHERVLFYLYAVDLIAVRERLIKEGVKVSAITYPEYLPAGEFQTEDRDGYCLMLAQSGDDTP